MERKIINPWEWQDQYSFVQANEVSGQKRIVFVSGQTSINGQGKSVHEGDIRAQTALSLDNLEAVLKQAGLTLAHVMRMTTYTTNVDLFLENYDVLAERLQKSGCRPAATLLGVTRLAFPELLVEIEATAVE